MAGSLFFVGFISHHLEHISMPSMKWVSVMLLWDTEAVQISSNYIMTVGRKVDIALRTKCK